MTWNTPKTDFITGDPLTAAQVNAVGDNLDYLLSDTPAECIVRSQAADYTTTSTSFVVIDTTNLAITLTPLSGRVLVWFSALGAIQSNTGYLDIEINGVRQSGRTDGYTAWLSGPVAFQVLYTGLSGSQVIKPMFKSSSGLVTLRCGAVAGVQTAVIFGAMQV